MGRRWRLGALVFWRLDAAGCTGPYVGRGGAGRHDYKIAHLAEKTPKNRGRRTGEEGAKNGGIPGGEG